MRVFSTSDIRNVALLGHSHCGKTSLAAALLHVTGATSRLLKVDEGATITDQDEEEIARKMSISTSIAWCVWKGKKINLIDTPGSNPFLHDTRAALAAADAALIMIDAVSGIGVSTRKLWNFARELDLPVAFVINKLDRDGASFSAVVASLQSAFGRTAVPLQLPVGNDKNFRAVADLIHMADIPGSINEEAMLAHENLVEAVAEGKDELMEEFFSKGTIGVEHIISGLSEEVRERRIFPILCASACRNIGTDLLADFIAEILPAPSRPADTHSVFVFKTAVDSAAGRVTYFKVMSGVVKEDSHLVNVRSAATERFAHLSVPFGRALQPVSEIRAGDIGVVSKLRETATGDTLAVTVNAQPFPAFHPPEPSVFYAVTAKTQSDENRLGAALSKLLEEDSALRFYRDDRTNEYRLAGNGMAHLEVVVSRLKRRHNVEIELHSPKIPYLETVRGSATAQGRHKKQSGGHGQFGDCHITIEPAARGTGFEFINRIFGGAIPKQFIPAVEKGISDAAHTGILAGFPVVDFRVTLTDGSYHDVDSSELAFKLAGRKAFRTAMENARPALLEPIMKVDVVAPVEFAGDLMSDVSGRRGRICGTDLDGGTQSIHALIPLAEMLDYGEELTSHTQGCGSFHMEAAGYDFLPSTETTKIVAAGKTPAHADDE